MLAYLPDRVAEGLGKLAGVQDLSGATEKLSREPIFCMETGTAGGPVLPGDGTACLSPSVRRCQQQIQLHHPLLPTCLHPAPPLRLYCLPLAAVRLFYWMRLSYREEAEVMGHPFINAPAAMRLFGVSHFETIWDDTTDTHCVLGWSDTQAVVAFRCETAWEGTALGGTAY
jgi:hypothetical protein